MALSPVNLPMGHVFDRDRSLELGIPHFPGVPFGTFSNVFGGYH